MVESGEAPGELKDTEYMCLECMNESLLGVVGIPLAQLGCGIVFNNHKHWMPKTIRCPHCKATLTMKGGSK